MTRGEIEQKWMNWRSNNYETHDPEILEKDL
jgi:hypothetical protein